MKTYIERWEIATRLNSLYKAYTSWLTYWQWIMKQPEEVHQEDFKGDISWMNWVGYQKMFLAELDQALIDGDVKIVPTPREQGE